MSRMASTTLTYDGNPRYLSQLTRNYHDHHCIENHCHTQLRTLLAHRGNIYNDEQTSLPLGLFTRGQTTPRQTSLPLAPLSKIPEDRLH